MFKSVSVTRLTMIFKEVSVGTHARYPESVCEKVDMMFKSLSVDNMSVTSFQMPTVILNTAEISKLLHDADITHAVCKFVLGAGLLQFMILKKATFLLLP